MVRESWSEKSPKQRVRWYDAIERCVMVACNVRLSASVEEVMAMSCRKDTE